MKKRYKLIDETKIDPIVIENKPMVTKADGWGAGGINWEFGTSTAHYYVKQITNKDLLYYFIGTLLSVTGSLDGRGVWRRMDTCYISMAEFLCCSPETITTLLISYPPIKVYKKGKW